MKFVRFCILLGSLLCGAAFGAMVSSLYEVDVPVASQSQADWQVAVKDAYDQVVIKVSANPNILQLPFIKENRAYAGSLVQSYKYDQDQLDTTGKKIVLHVQFESNSIDQLLRKANQPLLGRDRPVTLVWAVLQNDVGQTAWLTDNDNDNLLRFFQSTAGKKGLPLIWPMMQGVTVSNITPKDVVDENVTAVQNASQNYQTDSILAGVIQPISSGVWQGNWVLVKKGQVIRWKSQGNTTQQVLVQSVDQLNDNLTLATAITATGGKTQLQVVVDGVNGLDDYVAINKYLRSLGTVANIATDQLTNDKITMTITILGETRAFLEEINRQGKLVLQQKSNEVVNENISGDIPSPAPQTTFYFKWSGQLATNTQRNLQPMLVSAPALSTSDTGSSIKDDSEKIKNPDQHLVKLDEGSNVPEEVRP